MPDGKLGPRPRRLVRAGPSTGCSCELLIEMSVDPTLSALLHEHGLDATTLTRARNEVHEAADPEPADWRHRLELRSGRGGPHPQHQLLLAVVRSADTHAYRLLERLGTSPARLRKELVERMTQLSQRGPQRPHATPALPTRGGPLRQSEQRLASTATVPADRQPAAPVASGGRLSQASSGPAHPGPPSGGGSALPTALRRSGQSLQGAPQARSQTRAQARASGEREPLEREERSETRTKSLERIDPTTLGPLLGRERDLEMLADALSRARLRPTLLVAEPGSGRTALARHLANVLERPVFRLSAPDYEDEDALRADLEEVAEARGVAIMDDLDRIGGEVSPACLPALTQAWANGPTTLTLVSHEGRARLQAWLPGVLDTLDTLEAEPLSREHVTEAVRVAAPTLLASHRIELAAEARIEHLVRVADTFLGGLAMPGRALDLLDLAAARAVRQGDDELRHAHWVDVVTQRTGLARSRVDGSGDQDVLDLDTALARYVVGHEDALSTVASLIRRNRAGFSSGRPIASVLLLGPSGVGKTEIAKALAAALFDRDDALLRLDMSEYAESHAVARVVGAPPGYVGHEQGGALTDPMLAQPHRVVLLDEIEKAHRDVHQLMLQVFDDGRLTDGRGRTVDFRHAVIIMTSNLGAPLLEENPEVEGEAVLDEARRAFPIELWNRIEAPLVLRPLDADELHRVCGRLVRSSSQRLHAERGVQYELSARAAAHLVELAGDDPSLGARPLRHLLSREVEARVADAILRGRVRAGERLVVDFGTTGFDLRRA